MSSLLIIYYIGINAIEINTMLKAVRVELHIPFRAYEAVKSFLISYKIKTYIIKKVVLALFS